MTTTLAGTLPDVSEALFEWFQNVLYIKITKQTANFELTEFQTKASFFGVVQPTPFQSLRMKPEGQRQWKYQTVYATPALIWEIDDVVVYDGIRYRVTAKGDWKKHGYVEYSLTQDFTGGLA